MAALMLAGALAGIMSSGTDSDDDTDGGKKLRFSIYIPI